MEIYRNNWFKILVGMTETEWIKNPIMMCDQNMGEFALISIKELNDNQGKLIIAKDNLPEFIIYVRQFDDCNDKYFDTSSLQLMEYDTKHPVMFQVASNFNCQENGSSTVNFRSGQYLTGLMSDSTQGPSASGGAGYGAILRLLKHFESNINLLKDTEYASDVIEGKLYHSSNIDDFDINNVCIGLHRNVLANFDRSSYDNKCIYHKEGRIIDQVFTSTIISPSLQEHKIAENLLSAAYLGTYLSALYRRTEILVLTFIGGGCFNNPFNLIISAMVDAHIKVSPKTNLKKVIIPIFDGSKSPNLIVIELLRRGYPSDKIKIIKK